MKLTALRCLVLACTALANPPACSDESTLSGHRDFVGIGDASSSGVVQFDGPETHLFDGAEWTRLAELDGLLSRGDRSLDSGLAIDSASTSNDGATKFDVGRENNGTTGLTAFSVEQIQVLFSRTCAPCHTTGPFQPNVLDVTLLIGLTSPTIDFEQIVPGDRRASYTYIKLQDDPSEFGGAGEQMPPNLRPLDDDTIERFGLWIDDL